MFCLFWLWCYNFNRKYSVVRGDISYAFDVVIKSLPFYSYFGKILFLNGLFRFSNEFAIKLRQKCTFPRAESLCG